MTMQALVIAHACYGHNSFFKGNYLFRQWTSADAIIDYMVFARQLRDAVRGAPRRRRGRGAARCLPCADGLRRQPLPPPDAAVRRRGARALREREEYARAQYDEIWRTRARRARRAAGGRAAAAFPSEPQENLLYFVEKHSPRLAPWQRELVRIVRKIAQYFYPQGQTKVMNEGWATFWHYTILNRLLRQGAGRRRLHARVPDVAHQRRHAARLRRARLRRPQPVCARLRDVHRHAPDLRDARRDEDRHWFPDIAGGDWQPVLDFAMRNFKDESFIAQYLSPRLIREFHLFAIADHEDEDALMVDSIHNEHGYRRVRQLLAQQYDRDTRAARHPGRALRPRRRPQPDAAASAASRPAADRGRPRRCSITCSGCGASRCASRPPTKTAPRCAARRCAARAPEPPAAAMPSIAVRASGILPLKAGIGFHAHDRGDGNERHHGSAQRPGGAGRRTGAPAASAQRAVRHEAVRSGDEMEAIPKIRRPKSVHTTRPDRRPGGAPRLDRRHHRRRSRRRPVPRGRRPRARQDEEWRSGPQHDGRLVRDARGRGRSPGGDARACPTAGTRRWPCRPCRAAASIRPTSRCSTRRPAR